MTKILVGYGEFANYTLAEVSDKFLAELVKCYPLEADRYNECDGELLLITVAVHQESARRASGGRPHKRLPTVKELATEIVKKGFRHLSSIHHPDHQGQEEAQLRLTAARDHLLSVCENIEDDDCRGAVIIRERQSADRGIGVDCEISDDDVPF